MDLARQHGTDRQRRWCCNGTDSPFSRQVESGRLGDGRWYANARGDGLGEQDGRTAMVFAATDLGRTLALRLAYRWMSDLGGEWTPIPAAYDAQGRPTDGLPWVRSGRHWVLPDD